MDNRVGVAFVRTIDRGYFFRARVSLCARRIFKSFLRVRLLRRFSFCWYRKVNDHGRVAERKGRIHPLSIRSRCFFYYFIYLLFNQTPVAKEQIVEFSGGENAIALELICIAILCTLWIAYGYLSCRTEAQLQGSDASRRLLIKLSWTLLSHMDFPFLTYSAKSNDFVSCVMLFVREPAVNVYMHRLRFF